MAARAAGLVLAHLAGMVVVYVVEREQRARPGSDLWRRPPRAAEVLAAGTILPVLALGLLAVVQAALLIAALVGVPHR